MIIYYYDYIICIFFFMLLQKISIILKLESKNKNTKIHILYYINNNLKKMTDFNKVLQCKIEDIEKNA